MVATFSWVEYNANDTDTGVPTNLNLGSTNARDLAPSTYPITVGTYSYSKWVRGLWTGSFTRIENLQFWMSASGTGYVTGEKLNCNATTGTYDGTDTFSTPTTDAETAGGTMSAMPTADPGAANIGIGGSLTASLTSTGYSDFIIVQASIGATASAGAVQQKAFTLQYDEV
jgi:hypothetical protein